MGVVHGSDTHDLLFSRRAVSKTGRASSREPSPAAALAVLEHKSKHPRMRKRDRIFWVWMSRVWAGWHSALVIVQPDAVARWHRDSFRSFWRWKLRPGEVGRSGIEVELRKEIRRKCRERPSWGAPRIHPDLRLRRYDVSETTVDKYMVRHRRPPSQTPQPFVKNHVPDTVALVLHDAYIDGPHTVCVFCAGPDRRCEVQLNITQHPAAERTAHQVIEAFREDRVPRFLIRDRDSIYGHCLKNRINNAGIEEVVTARQFPWKDPYVERIHSSIRRGCWNQAVVLNELNLKRILSSNLAYYHEDLTHLSLVRNSPTPREIEVPRQGKVVSAPRNGGLHHRYRRGA